MYISIHSLCSILCWCTFGSNYSLKYFWIWCHKLGTPIFGQFCPFLFAAPLKLHQVGWEVSVHSHFQISPEMFNRILVWALAWPLKDIHRVVLKPLLWYLGCVLRVVVLLKDEPSPQSEVKSALEQVFIQDPGYIAAFIFPSILTSLPVPAAEQHPHSMMLPPPCFTVGMVLAWWWAVPGSSKHDAWHSCQRVQSLSH